MKRIIIAFFSFIKFMTVFGCKLGPNSTFLQDNINHSKSAFGIMLAGVLLYAVLSKIKKLKILILLAFLSFIHPYLWFKNYDDCGITFKNISLLYSIIIVAILSLLFFFKKVKKGNVRE